MVTLVATTGSGSMDICAQRLSERLGVPRVYSEIHQHIRDRFNISWFSREASRAILDDWNFMKLLNKSSGMIHFPNQHIRRYGDFIKRLFIIPIHVLIRCFDLKGFGAYIHYTDSR